MLVKRHGGMTEFIPSPSEKRDGVIHNHVLNLLANLDARLRQLEHAASISSDLAGQFSETIARIKREEQHVQQLNETLRKAGITHGEESSG